MKDLNKIWTAFKEGEQEAFSWLFFNYYTQLYQYGKKLIQNEELVKDVIQDFYLYLFENRESLASEINNLTAYLLSSFRRRLLLEATRSRKIQNRQIAEEHADTLLFVIGIEEIIIVKESRTYNKKLILQLLNELSPRQREILYLKYYMNLSLPEISDTLSISYQVVANHLYRALKKLRESEKISKIGRLGLDFLFV